MIEGRVHITFWIVFGLSLILIAALVVLYFVQFHGNLSENISDWANFSSFIYGFSTIALTAVNVWLFYQLTSAANSMNSKSQETSTKIVDAFTEEEKKRSHAQTGVTLMQEYNNAHDKLMQQIPIGIQKKVNYTAIGIAASQLEAVYQILHRANEIFPSLQTYTHHDDYIEELRGIANQTDDEQIIRNDFVIPNTENLTYQRFNSINQHHRTVVFYYKEILNLIQTDLGAVYKSK